MVLPSSWQSATNTVLFSSDSNYMRGKVWAESFSDLEKLFMEYAAKHDEGLLASYYLQHQSSPEGNPDDNDAGGSPGGGDGAGNAGEGNTGGGGDVDDHSGGGDGPGGGPGGADEDDGVGAVLHMPIPRPLATSRRLLDFPRSPASPPLEDGIEWDANVPFNGLDPVMDGPFRYEWVHPASQDTGVQHTEPSIHIKALVEPHPHLNGSLRRIFKVSTRYDSCTSPTCSSCCLFPRLSFPSTSPTVLLIVMWGRPFQTLPLTVPQSGGW